MRTPQNDQLVILHTSTTLNDQLTTNVRVSRKNDLSLRIHESRTPKRWSIVKEMSGSEEVLDSVVRTLLAATVILDKC